MYVKACCFVLIALACFALLWLRAPGGATLALCVGLAWASARLYYFFFYVIERYIDPAFRFDGLVSVARHLLRPARSARRASPRTRP